MFHCLSTPTLANLMILLVVIQEVAASGVKQMAFICAVHAYN